MAYQDTPTDPLLALAAVRPKALTFGRARSADEQFRTRYDSDTYRQARRAAMRPVASRLRQADMLAMAQRCANRMDELRAVAA